MPRKHSHSSDLRGLSRLIVDAILGATDLAEQVNLSVLNSATKFAAPIQAPLTNATATVYRQVRQLTHLAGTGIDGLLGWLTPSLIKNRGWRGREPVVAVLNGVLGDYLHNTENPLAIEMELRCRGLTLPDNQPEMKELLPNPGGRLVLLVHGLCMSDQLWQRNSHDHGAALERDSGYTPVYLRYNSGLHISTNGRQLSDQLEALLLNWPVAIEQVNLLCHSMGGMVVRSALYYADKNDHNWPSLVAKIVFLGTPHHGAPLERGGHWFHLLLGSSGFLAPFSSLGRIRSAGITDLRHGNLLDQDWNGVDRFTHSADIRNPVPLPDSIECYALAATIGKRESDVTDRLLGDGLVPINSALGIHQNPHFNLAFKPENQVILRGMNHLDLLNSAKVYQQIQTWMASPEASCNIS